MRSKGELEYKKKNHCEGQLQHCERLFDEQELPVIFCDLQVCWGLDLKRKIIAFGRFKTNIISKFRKLLLNTKCLLDVKRKTIQWYSS